MLFSIDHKTVLADKSETRLRPIERIKRECLSGIGGNDCVNSHISKEKKLQNRAKNDPNRFKYPRNPLWNRIEVREKRNQSNDSSTTDYRNNETVLNGTLVISTTIDYRDDGAGFGEKNYQRQIA
ncbi:hypothetical protein RDWZM_002913 [Blomia tropicalis]|uniref:Uncharacterized protein n=1 Tax=Blomia tropicalis TaxID=40697 RepID=A0A9Q0MFU4_BLOTA|nr:hypothetical protein RDWZM_002913 [Blomia tropicalis]